MAEPMPLFEANEAAFLLNHCDASKARWARRCDDAASHKDIAKRDQAVAKIAQIDAVIAKIHELTSE